MPCLGEQFGGGDPLPATPEGGSLPAPRGLAEGRPDGRRSTPPRGAGAPPGAASCSEATGAAGTRGRTAVTGPAGSGPAGARRAALAATSDKEVV